eukprot:560098-Amphidinium_carterae.1
MATIHGSSNSRQFQRVLRRHSAIELAVSLHPAYVFVPSHLSPADAPSRELALLLLSMPLPGLPLH